jgi:FtsX-like permease family
VDGTFVALFPATLVAKGDVGNASTLYAIDLAPGTSRADLRAELGRLGGTPLTLKPPEIVPEQLRTAVRIQGIGYAVFAGIAALTTAIVVGQLLSRQYRLDESERVVLRSLGFTRGQLAAEPLARAAPPLLFGALLAVPIAYLASGVFPRGLAKDVEAQPGLLVQPLVLFPAATAFVVAVVVVVTISTIVGGVARPALRRVPWVDRVAPKVSNVPAGLGLRFAFSRTSARDRSVVAPLVGLGLVAVLLLGALTFGDNLRTLIDDPQIWGTNYDAVVGQGGAVDAKRLSSLIDGGGIADDVDAVSLYGSGTAQAEDVSLQLVVVQQLKGDLGPVVLSGRLPAGAGQIALGRVAARHLHVDVGDSIVVQGEKAKRRLEITGLVIPNTAGGIELDGDGGSVDPAAAAALGVQPETSVAVVRFVPGAPANTPARVARATASQGIGGESAPSVITNLDRVRSIPFLVGLLAAVLAIATLGHQAVMGVRRRRPDLAVLRALGLPRRKLGSIVHWQVTLAVLAVLVVAVPVGVALGSVLYRTFPDQMGAVTTTEVPWASIAAASVGLLVLANLIVIVPGRRAGRARMRAD